MMSESDVQVLLSGSEPDLQSMLTRFSVEVRIIIEDTGNNRQFAVWLFLLALEKTESKIRYCILKKSFTVLNISVFALFCVF